LSDWLVIAFINKGKITEEVMLISKIFKKPFLKLVLTILSHSISKKTLPRAGIHSFDADMLQV